MDVLQTKNSYKDRAEEEMRRGIPLEEICRQDTAERYERKMLEPYSTIPSTSAPLFSLNGLQQPNN
ncbi:unnamed protein product, partial [Gongylonema pulchrum]|uniref:Uncharacterized protein n=1 Tax=Gongylonema pulchrum TaxID=637853 RepID=A0A183EWG1_9BILA